MDLSLLLDDLGDACAEALARLEDSGPGDNRWWDVALEINLASLALGRAEELARELV